MSELHNVVDAWLRQGQPEPAPEELRAHLQHCSRCQRGLAEIQETRAWYPEPGECITDDAASAIRFQLQTAANLASHQGVSAKARRRFAFDRVEWAYAAVLLLAAVGVGVYVSEWLPKTTNSVPAALAVLEPLSGTRVQRVDASERDEVYRFDSGVVRFSVPKLRDGRRVLVIVGDEMVSVRGTRFEVHAAYKRLQAVMVEEGLVSIRLQSGKELEVGAGKSWRRGEGVAVAREPRLARPKTQPATASSQKITRAPAAPATEHQTKARDRDVAFAQAWQMYQAGRFDEAAAAFDALLERDLANRRSDVLYWAGISHEAAGRSKRALELLQALLRDYPGSWQAAKAREKVRELAGEVESQESP